MDKKRCHLELRKIKLTDIVEDELDFYFTDNYYFSELYKSIEQLGLLEPISVYKDSDKYKILNGRQRFKIYQRLKLTEIDSIIVENVEENFHKKLLSTQFITKTPDHFKLAEYILENDLQYEDVSPGILNEKKNFKNYRDIFNWKWSRFHTEKDLESIVRNNQRKKLF